MIANVPVMSKIRGALCVNVKMKMLKENYGT